MFSVIVPCFHADNPDNIRRLVSFLLEENDDRCEVILVDGTGNLDTKIYSELQEAYGTQISILLRPNQDILQSLIDGVNNSSRDYIIPMFPNDIPQPKYIARFYDAIKRNGKFDGFECNVTDIAELMQNGEIVLHKYEPDSKKYTEEKIVEAWAKIDDIYKWQLHWRLPGWCFKRNVCINAIDYIQASAHPKLDIGYDLVFLTACLAASNDVMELPYIGYSRVFSAAYIENRKKPDNIIGFVKNILELSTYLHCLCNYADRTYVDYINEVLQNIAHDLLINAYGTIDQFKDTVDTSLLLEAIVNNKPAQVPTFIKNLQLKANHKAVKNIALSIQRAAFGGAESYTRKFKQELIRVGYDVKHITQEPSELSDICLPHVHAKNWDWERNLMPKPSNNLLQRKRQLQETIEQYNFDTFVLMSHWFQETHWDVLLLKELGMNVIWMEHNNVLWSLYHNQREMWQYKRWFMKLADFTVVLSPYDQYLFRKLGVDNAVFIPNIRTFTNIKKRNVTEPVLLACTRIAPIKNILGLLDVLYAVKKQVPAVKLKIVGQLENKEYVNEVQSYAQELRLTNNIEISGYIENIQDEYLNSKMLLSTSYCEGDPMTFQEALDCRKPVVSLGLKYLHRNRIHGIINVDTKEEMSQTIVKLLVKDKEYNKIVHSIKTDDVPSNKNILDMWKTLFNRMNQTRTIDFYPSLSDKRSISILLEEIDNMLAFNLAREV